MLLIHFATVHCVQSVQVVHCELHLSRYWPDPLTLFRKLSIARATRLAARTLERGWSRCCTNVTISVVWFAGEPSS